MKNVQKISAGKLETESSTNQVSLFAKYPSIVLHAKYLKSSVTIYFYYDAGSENLRKTKVYYPFLWITQFSKKTTELGGFLDYFASTFRRIQSLNSAAKKIQSRG